MQDNHDLRLLAYALYDKSLTIKVIDKVKPEFLRKQYRPILLAMIECVKRYNEVPTVEMLRRTQYWDKSFVGIIDVAIDIKNDPDFEPKNLALEIEDLKEAYKRRLLLKAGKEVFQENYKNGDFVDLNLAIKTVRRVSGEIEQIDSERIYKEGNVAETAEETKEEYIRRKENPESTRGILTGIRELDQITNGFQGSELILVGGESGTGKSLLSHNMAIGAWLGNNGVPKENEPFGDFDGSGVNVIYFTIEMPWAPFRRRFDACLAEVPLYGIRDGTLSPEEEKKYYRALEFQQLYNKNFHIVDIPRECTVAQIESKFLEIKYDFIPELIVVDYITLMKSDHNDSDWLGVGKVAEQLHEFARTYNISVITPVQLNRPKNEDEVPSQNRVGRSLLLNQNCNLMLNIHTRKDEAARNDMSINIAKNRDGEQKVFSLYKRFDLMRVYNDFPTDWLDNDEDMI